jgi:hypothetical protein
MAPNRARRGPEPLPDSEVNRARYVPGQRSGWYESFYQRGNHPTEPRAFWIRYTLFSPAGRPEAAVGELWAVYFDGVTGAHVVAREEHPLAGCLFDRSGFSVRVGESTLGPDQLSGGAGGIGWDLRYAGSGQPPVYLLPRRLYSSGFPKAKSLVGSPNAVFSGRLTVDGRPVDVTGWVGSQNHNWGSRHTDHYAFGQVAGFDQDPGAFLEVATARARLAGPLHTPKATFLVLRESGREHALVSLPQAFRTRAAYRYFAWAFAAEDRTVRIRGHITADAAAFVALRYRNPPGGTKHCLNTKIASCRVEVIDKPAGTRRILSTSNRALFEILTDDPDHGIPLST